MKLILRILIIICSMILAVLLYTHFFSLELTNESLVSGISKRVDSDVVVNDYVEVEKYILVNFYFEEENTSYEGYITLLKGLNGKYRLGDGYFEPSTENLIFNDFEFTESHHLIVFGSSPLTDGIFIKSKVSDEYMPISTSNHTFEVFESDSFVASIEGYSYETDEGIVEIKLDNEIKPIIDHSGELYSGPEKIVWLSSVLIVIIGFVISFLFTPERNRLETLYYKITKQQPEITDGDCTDHMMLH
ncbi:MAG: hypothetical protein JEZ08_24025 [Clostridiales bacterium]|nr:hypothetical protein [Clostridiales bacterium]